MRNLLYAATAITALAFSPALNAAQIITFGQTSGANTITGTASGGVTTISGTNVSVDITQIDATGITTPVAAFLTLTAHSTGPATLSGANDVQAFTGTFSITSGANDTGTNYLSGSFTDTVGGPPGGAALELGVAQPPDTLSLTSDVITTLAIPNGLSFALTNIAVPPGVHIDTTTAGSPTLGSFNASISGNASASPAGVPEPASLGLLGVGLLGLGFAASRKRSA